MQLLIIIVALNFSTAVLRGYPPQELPSYDPTATLQDLHLKSGETLIVEETTRKRERTVGVTTSAVSEQGSSGVVRTVDTFVGERKLTDGHLARK